MSDKAKARADAKAKAKADAKAEGPRRVRVIKGERPTSNGGGYLGQEGEVIRRSETEPGSRKHVVEVTITSEMRRGQYVTLQPGEYEEISGE